ncbi:MAG: hypothetical protein AABX11_06350 [Nanoarchaeota archaeon]
MNSLELSSRLLNELMPQLSPSSSNILISLTACDIPKPAPSFWDKIFQRYPVAGITYVITQDLNSPLNGEFQFHNSPLGYRRAIKLSPKVLDITAVSLVQSRNTHKSAGVLMGGEEVYKEHTPKTYMSFRSSIQVNTQINHPKLGY